MALLRNVNLSIETSLKSISEMMGSARQAQKTWALVPFSSRKIYLDKMLSYILEHADEIVETLCRDTGKTRSDAMADEIIPCAFACKWYGENAESVLQDKMLKTSIPLMLNKKSLITRIPLGVVGIISPWNYPLSIPFGEVLMGLMAGNAVILKTSYEVTPNIGTLISKIISSSGLPEGLFYSVEIPGPEFSEALFASGIDKIFFTGSVRVGKELMRKASETLTPLSLELGGNDPMLVFEDADLERASNGAIWGAYQNAGQTCAGIERVYVHEKIYESFVNLLAEKTRHLKHGSYKDENVDMGAITTEKQLATITLHVEEALKKGAKILAQSQAVGELKGHFFPATLIVDVNHSMMIMNEETFGPILCVMKFNDEAQAIELANKSQYALTSSVWTKDLEKGKRVGRLLESGVTTINDHLLTHGFSETPWGGWKQSGIGRTHGAIGLEEMTHCKVLNWDLLPSKRNLYWYPGGSQSYQNLKKALSLSFERNPLKFLGLSAKFLPVALKKIFRSDP